jgi:hypothetical protein
LQVYLIYSDTNITDDSFYSRIKNCYPNLRENLDILKYFEDFQEPLWKRVKNVFSRQDRHLLIPPRKKGSGRYVQFPKSQQLIRWNKLVEYADRFIAIKLAPDRILSFDDFINKVYIPDDYRFSHEENEVIRKIVFSFYNKWDGRPSDEIRNKRFNTRSEITPNRPESEITIRLNYEEICIYSNGRKISESEMMKNISDKLIIPFVFDEDYQDWKYTKKILQAKDRLLLLVNKSSKKYADNFEKMKYGDLKMEYFHVFIFDKIDSEIANFANLNFDKKEIFTIIGGIKANNNYNFVNNVIGAWFDFALPKVKINLPSSTKVFIDSNEIVADKNQIDLSNLVLKKNGQKYSLPPGKYTLKCSGVSPAYFFIEECKSSTNTGINCGWIISSTDLRPVKNGEKPCVIGLKTIKSKRILDDTHLRPFLSQIEYLQTRPLERFLNKKIKMIEKRRLYGV